MVFSVRLPLLCVKKGSFDKKLIGIAGEMDDSFSILATEKCVNDVDDFLHMAFVEGEIDPENPTLVRVHSECLTGDVFGSMRCDCGEQLETAMKMMEEEGYIDPRDSRYGPLQRLLLSMKFYGQVLINQNAYYCFGNCRMGLYRSFLSEFLRQVNVVYQYLSGAQSDFGLYDTDDLRCMMNEAGLDGDDDDEVFKLKRYIAAAYAGQLRAQSEDRKRREKENEEERKRSKHKSPRKR